MRTFFSEELNNFKNKIAILILTHNDIDRNSSAADILTFLHISDHASLVELKVALRDENHPIWNFVKRKRFEIIGNEKRSTVYKSPSVADSNIDSENDCPPIWKYIVAWVLAGVLVTISSIIIGAVPFVSEDTVNKIWLNATIGFSLDSIISGAIIAFIYSMFSSLKMSSVFPWLIGASFFGQFLTIGIYFFAGIANMVPVWFYFYGIACQAVMLYVIWRFFKYKGRML